MIQLEKYNEVYLENSWRWLNDPETKPLTDTGDFTLQQQQNWFKNIDANPAYKIWGVSFGEVPIGVCGIKNINVIEKKAEYWGYIGEKQYWFKGLGTIVLGQVLQIAITELNLKYIYLKVLKINIVAIHLYKKFNFIIIGNENKNFIMQKTLLKT